MAANEAWSAADIVCDPCSEQTKKPSFKPFFFAQMADSQLGMFESFAQGGTGWDEEKRLLGKAVSEINRLQPALAIVCGDLVNSYPAADGAEPEGSTRAAQIRDFKAAWATCTVPLVCVCGNHDIGNTPTAASVAAYRKDFGKDYFAFTVEGTNVRCIVLNSQFWKDDSGNGCREMRIAQDEWLEAELTGQDAREAQHVLVFMHIPPFIRRFDEPDGYFNLSNKAVGNDDGGAGADTEGPGVRTKLMQLFAKHGVRAVFCGHYHRNAGGWYEEGDRTKRRVEVVVTGAVGTNVDSKDSAPPGSEDELNICGMGKPVLGDDRSGMRIVEVVREEVRHRWYTLNEVAALERPKFGDSATTGADSTAETDQRRLQEAETFFQARCKPQFPEIDGVSAEEVANLLRDDPGSVVLVDTRSAEEIQVSQLAQRVFTPSSFEKAFLCSDSNGSREREQQMQSFASLDGKTVIAYCGIGGRSGVYVKNTESRIRKAHPQVKRIANFELSTIAWCHAGHDLWERVQGQSQGQGQGEDTDANADTAWRKRRRVHGWNEKFAAMYPTGGGWEVTVEPRPGAGAVPSDV